MKATSAKRPTSESDLIPCLQGHITNFMEKESFLNSIHTTLSSFLFNTLPWILEKSYSISSNS